MERLRAEEEIDRRGGDMKAEELRRWVYLATGDEERAEDAWLARAERDTAREKQ